MDHLDGVEPPDGVMTDRTFTDDESFRQFGYDRQLSIEGKKQRAVMLRQEKDSSRHRSPHFRGAVHDDMLHDDVTLDDGLDDPFALYPNSPQLHSSPSPTPLMATNFAEPNLKFTKALPPTNWSSDAAKNTTSSARTVSSGSVALPLEFHAGDPTKVHKYSSPTLANTSTLTSMSTSDVSRSTISTQPEAIKIGLATTQLFNKPQAPGRPQIPQVPAIPSMPTSPPHITHSFRKNRSNTSVDDMDAADTHDCAYDDEFSAYNLSLLTAFQIAQVSRKRSATGIDESAAQRALLASPPSPIASIPIPVAKPPTKTVSFVSTPHDTVTTVSNPNNASSARSLDKNSGEWGAKRPAKGYEAAAGLEPANFDATYDNQDMGDDDEMIRQHFMAEKELTKQQNQPKEIPLLMPEAFAEDGTPLALTSTILAGMPPERAAETMRNYIKQLGMFIPGRLTNWYIARAAELTNTVSHKMFCEQFEGAVLFVDISGFSRLAEDLERRNRKTMATKNLAQEVGEALGPLVKIILEWGGDVIKFAGDAMFAIFSKNAHHGMQGAVAAACLAARKMVRFSLFNARTGVKLTVHCGIAAGSILEIHVGGVLNRWEYTISGDPLLQVTRAEKLAQAGQVVISPEAHSEVLEFCQTSTIKDTDGTDTNFFLLQNMAGEELGATLVRANRFWDDLDKMDCDTLHKIYLHIIPYVPRPVIQAMSGDEIGDKFAFLAEVRMCVTLFIKLTNISFTQKSDVNELHKIVRLVQKKMYSYNGATLCRLIVDDKGLTNLWAFGMPPHDMTLTENFGFYAVLAAMDLHKALVERERSCSVGITAGRVFCGTVGGSQRSEYTLHGTQVNLAARLMMKAEDGVLVDDHVHAITSDMIDYDPPFLTEVKGKDGSIQVYRPRQIREAHRGMIPDPNRFSVSTATDSFKDMTLTTTSIPVGSFGDKNQSGLGEWANTEAPTIVHDPPAQVPPPPPVSPAVSLYNSLLPVSPASFATASSNRTLTTPEQLPVPAHAFGQAQRQRMSQPGHDSRPTNNADHRQQRGLSFRRSSDPIYGSANQYKTNNEATAVNFSNLAVLMRRSSDTHNGSAPKVRTAPNMGQSGGTVATHARGSVSVPETRKSRTSTLDLLRGLNPTNKYCRDCGKLAGMTRKVCQHCGGQRFTTTKGGTIVKRCAACNHGTRNKKRAACEYCGSHRWVEPSAQK